MRENPEAQLPALYDEVRGKIRALGVEKANLLSREDLENLLGKHFGKEYIHLSSIFLNPAENSATSFWGKADMPSWIFAHHPNGEAIMPGVQLVEMANQTLATLLLQSKSPISFVSRETHNKLKAPINPEKGLTCKVTITSFRTKTIKGKTIVIAEAVAQIFEKDSTKVAAEIEIKGAGEILG
jgi:3-hydroxymyristoyl/3-hydroxydecanoyl-(acyl carrier protein) dehydratase